MLQGVMLQGALGGPDEARGLGRTWECYKYKGPWEGQMKGSGSYLGVLQGVVLEGVLGGPDEVPQGVVQ